MDYDLIVIGGGLGGAALARAMAAAGKRVLVLERETRFRDRVRGEQMATWGVADAKALGIYDLLCGSCARQMPWFDIWLGPMQVQHRNVIETTPQGLPNLTFYHPKMQETLLAAAKDAGAAVVRGARATGVALSGERAVTWEHDGKTERAMCRMVVAADGRSSPARTWSSFEQRQDPDRLQISGVVYDEMAIDDDVMRITFDIGSGRSAILFPQGGGRVRAYLVTRVDSGERLSGDGDLPRFVEHFRTAGVPAEFLEGARPAGPLATFNGADNWVPHPYEDGLALLGDAAATSDPTWGQGLSLTLRDARLLRDALLAGDDWDAAGHRYAEEHDAGFHVIHETEDWLTELFYDPGAEGNLRRMRVLPRMEEAGPLADAVQAGPDGFDVSPEARARFFGET